MGVSPTRSRFAVSPAGSGGRGGLSVRVDLHNHTHYSGDGSMAPLELLERAAAAGIDCLGVTDHDSLDGALACLDLSRGDPALPRVIPGMEICTGRGEVVALYVSEPIPSGLGPARTIERIRELGGVSYLPHPFDRMRRSTIEADARESAAGLVDVIEVRNGRILRSRFDRESLDLAARLGKAMGAGSDAHYPGEVGRCFVRVAAMPDRDSLVALLRAGRPVEGPGRRDRARAWGYLMRTGLGKMRRRLS